LSLLKARLKRLENNYEIVRFASFLIEVRDELVEKVELSRLTKPGFVEKTASAIAKGSRPLLDEEIINNINFDYLSQVFVDLFKTLKERAAVDGEVDRITQGLKNDSNFVRKLFEYAAGLLDEPPANVERELLLHIVFIPLQPLLKSINQLNSRLDTPTYVRSCLTCGKKYITGVYRGGFRHMLCSACGHLARVDFFYCPSCGTTDPHALRFQRFQEEPYFQLEICDRCGAYYKMVNEDIVGSVSEDPMLLDFATIDLDNVANTVKQKTG